MSQRSIPGRSDAVCSLHHALTLRDVMVAKRESASLSTTRPLHPAAAALPHQN